MKYLFRSIILLLVFNIIVLGQNNLSLSSHLINFGYCQIHQLTGLAAQIENNGNTPVNITKITLTDTHFTTDLSPEAIPSSASITFHLNFNPETNIDYYGTIVIEYENMSKPEIIELQGTGDLGMPYYNGTTNLWGSDLKLALHNIIKGHTQLSYSGLWNALQNTDADTTDASKVILLYSGWKYDGDNHGGAVSQWNREHVWAKAHGDFGTTPPEGTDLHHIRPTDVSVNSRRGNLDFDTGGSLYVDGDGATECYVDNDSWEPRDEVKGDVARMMYYMVVRYEGDDTSHDLELVENIPSGLTSPQGYFGKQSTLYQWHLQDPVNNWERRRNDRIDNNWQHNRNPFIDHPEFASRMPSISGQPLTKDEPQLTQAPTSFSITLTSSDLPLTIHPILINSGGGEINFNTISSSHSDFTIDRTSFTLPAHSIDSLSIQFNTTSPGNYLTTITGNTDWADMPTFNIPISVTVSETTGIPDDPYSFNKTFYVKANYPNPFNPQTQLQVVSDSDRNARLIIFNSLGQKISNRTVRLRTGQNNITIDGSNWTSGLYYYRFESGIYRAAGKMMLLK